MGDLKSKDLKANEAINKINELTDIEEICNFVADDDRKSVITVKDSRLKALSNGREDEEELTEEDLELLTEEEKIMIYTQKAMNGALTDEEIDLDLEDKIVLGMMEQLESMLARVENLRRSRKKVFTYYVMTRRQFTRIKTSLRNSLKR